MLVWKEWSMVYELHFQLICHDLIRIISGKIWEVIKQKKEKESLMTTALYKLTKTLLVAH